MALKPVSCHLPLGQFDALDADLTSFKGGEVCGFTYVSITGSDKRAKDDDGYASTAVQNRPAVTFQLTPTTYPLFLADDGTAGYGTLFGQIVGGTAGSVVTGGTVLGPHSALGSGKITLWDKPGLYEVTLDAVDTNATTGLVPSNTGLSGGDELYATTAGLLTPNAGADFGALVIVGRFIEFKTAGSLVTSRLDMVQALNSPTGATGVARGFDRALITFHPSDPLTAAV